MTHKTLAATAIQATWGFPQLVVGGAIALACSLHGCRHLGYRTAIVTLWHLDRGLSLGPFVFVPERYPAKAMGGLVAHEYGHTLQSLLLGPLYLPVVVLPSLVWAGLPTLERRRRSRRVSYYSFYTERWANKLSKRITGDTPEGM